MKYFSHVFTQRKAKSESEWGNKLIIRYNKGINSTICHYREGIRSTICQKKKMAGLHPDIFVQGVQLLLHYSLYFEQAF